MKLEIISLQSYVNWAFREQLSFTRGTCCRTNTRFHIISSLLDSQTKVQEGIIFTGVCLSFSSEGSHVPITHDTLGYGLIPWIPHMWPLLASSGHHWRPVQICSLEDLIPPVLTSSGGHQSRWYASYKISISFKIILLIFHTATAWLTLNLWNLNKCYSEVVIESLNIYIQKACNFLLT